MYSVTREDRIRIEFKGSVEVAYVADKMGDIC